jgi:hypothetical protein
MKKASEELTTMLEEFLAGEPAVGVAEVTAGAVPALAEGRPSLEKDELEAALRELESSKSRLQPEIISRRRCQDSTID